MIFYYEIISSAQLEEGEKLETREWVGNDRWDVKGRTSGLARTWRFRRANADRGL